MLKLILSSYSGRELQNFLSILNQCETKGIVDIRLVREQIYSHVHNNALHNRIGNVISKRKMRKQLKNEEDHEICPSCGNARLYPVKSEEGVSIIGCSKCRYSKLIEGN